MQRFFRHLRHHVSAGEPYALTDSQLLDRFVRDRDEAAFEVLLSRHGPLVLSACRRLLLRSQDVEDAFQATFLVLASKASAIRRRKALAGWLYRVAYRIAVRARQESAERAAREQTGAEELAAAPVEDSENRDLREVLDEEVSHLPERYRAPFVLCYLQGKTNEQAARELGRPVGTILSRLAWARQRLRTRLTRRGVGISAVALAALAGEASAAVPGGLLETTRQTAMNFAANASAGVLPVRPATLAKGVLRTMYLTKIRWMTIVVAVLGLLLGGAGVVLQGTKGDGLQPRAHGSPTVLAMATVPAPEEQNVCEVPARYTGVILVIGREIPKGERAPAGEVIKLKVGEEQRSFRRLKVGDLVAKGQLLGLLDDRLIRDEIAMKDQKIIKALADQSATEKTLAEARERLEILEALKRKGNAIVPDEDVRGARLTKDRFEQELIARKADVELARLDLKTSKTLLEHHEIRSPATGVIKRILKRPGEAVRELEPVVVLEVREEP